MFQFCFFLKMNTNTQQYNNADISEIQLKIRLVAISEEVSENEYRINSVIVELIPNLYNYNMKIPSEAADFVCTFMHRLLLSKQHTKTANLSNAVANNQDTSNCLDYKMDINAAALI
jgi:hypothetical protein